MTWERDHTAWIHQSTLFNGNAAVGFCSCIGHDASTTEPVRIGDGVRIGAFCLIAGGTQLAADVEIDHYCRIGFGVSVGTKSRILYRAQVFDEVRIGENCIIAGDLVDRTIVGSNVTFHGTTAHTHADATRDWDVTEEASPVINSGSVVGVGAILIGGVVVGPRAYVAAGERVTCDVPTGMVLSGGKLTTVAAFRGIVKVREA